ncbi:hypothetical protein [Pontiella sp.]|uniref:hypothetical protein n=1 Tax=Pontiella sp. TaxID=2837462 RepID=UPI0035674D69
MDHTGSPRDILMLQALLLKHSSTAFWMTKRGTDLFDLPQRARRTPSSKHWNLHGFKQKGRAFYAATMIRVAALRDAAGSASQPYLFQGLENSSAVGVGEILDLAFVLRVLHDESAITDRSYNVSKHISFALLRP